MSSGVIQFSPSLHCHRAVKSAMLCRQFGRACLSGWRRTAMKTTFCLATLVALASGMAAADEVTDWNRIMLDALLVAPAPAAPLAERPAAIVMAAVFDAVNGIERRYTPIHVSPDAPRGASKRAAAVQAAYASLVRLFPSQSETLDQKRTISLSDISSGAAVE